MILSDVLAIFPSQKALILPSQHALSFAYASPEVSTKPEGSYNNTKRLCYEQNHPEPLQ